MILPPSMPSALIAVTIMKCRFASQHVGALG